VERVTWLTAYTAAEIAQQAREPGRAPAWKWSSLRGRAPVGWRRWTACSRGFGEAIEVVLRREEEDA